MEKLFAQEIWTPILIAQCLITAWHHTVTALPFVTHLPATTKLERCGATMGMTQMVAGWDLIVQQHVLKLHMHKSEYPLLDEVDQILILSSTLF